MPIGQAASALSLPLASAVKTVARPLFTHAESLPDSRLRPGLSGSRGVANLRPATRDPVRPGPCPGHNPRIEARRVAMVPLKMDWDPQLNFYYCYSVAIMDRFICQPKFAGKTYMKFEGQELKQRIRLESKLPISRSAAHRHAQGPLLHLLYADKLFSGMH